MPNFNDTENASVSLKPKQRQFLAALYALIAEYDITELMSDEGAAAPMRLHKNFTAPDFNPPSHSKAPQYTSIALTDSAPESIIVAGEEFRPNRVQLSLNFFHLVPESYVEPAKAEPVAVAGKAATRIALTAGDIRNALSAKKDVVAA